MESELLKLVRDEELAGREVRRRFEKSRRRTLDYWTLYHLFSQLEHQGLVSVRLEADDYGPIRFFSITQAGKDALA